MLDGLPLCKGCEVPMLLSFVIPKVLLFYSDGVPAYSDSGPCYSNGVFSFSPGWGGGAKGERIWGLLLGRCLFSFSWLGGGVFFLFSHLGGRGKRGGHAEKSTVTTRRE